MPNKPDKSRGKKYEISSQAGWAKAVRNVIFPLMMAIGSTSASSAKADDLPEQKWGERHWEEDVHVKAERDLPEEELTVEDRRQQIFEKFKAMKEVERQEATMDELNNGNERLLEMLKELKEMLKKAREAAEKGDVKTAEGVLDDKYIIDVEKLVAKMKDGLKLAELFANKKKLAEIRAMLEEVEGIIAELKALQEQLKEGEKPAEAKEKLIAETNPLVREYYLNPSVAATSKAFEDRVFNGLEAMLSYPNNLIYKKAGEEITITKDPKAAKEIPECEVVIKKGKIIRVNGINLNPGTLDEWGKVPEKYKEYSHEIDEYVEKLFNDEEVDPPPKEHRAYVSDIRFGMIERLINLHDQLESTGDKAVDEHFKSEGYVAFREWAKKHKIGDDKLIISVKMFDDVMVIRVIGTEETGDWDVEVMAAFNKYGEPVEEDGDGKFSVIGEGFKNANWKPLPKKEPAAEKPESKVADEAEKPESPDPATPPKPDETKVPPKLTAAQAYLKEVTANPKKLMTEMEIPFEREQEVKELLKFVNDHKMEKWAIAFFVEMDKELAAGTYKKPTINSAHRALRFIQGKVRKAPLERKKLEELTILLKDIYKPTNA